MHAPSFKNCINPLSLLLGAGGLLLVMRLWMSLCFFPISGWNNIRLTPSFMLRFGPTPYPGLDGGPLTTWIYGPVPLFLNLPATFAFDAAAALIIAGVINLLIAVVPTGFVLFASSPSPQTARWTDRAWAFLVCLALWPNSSLQYIQADNAAVGFGLVANFLLQRSCDRSWIQLLPAAICAALAVWSKQTSLGLIFAQVLWLGVSSGGRASINYTLACAACGFALGGIFVAWFGFDGLWLNLVKLPSAIPFWADLRARTTGLGLHIAGYVLLPALALVIARRAVWKRDSPWLLPALTWLCLLPLGLVSIYKIGGTANSLNGFIYLLPAAALALVTALRPWQSRLTTALLASGVAATILVQINLSTTRSMRPLTEPLNQADYLASRFSGQIYFPWFPLVTYYSEHHFYHAEDGLYARYTAQLAPTRAAALRNLPARWSITVFFGPMTGWGIIEQLHPPAVQKSSFGAWTVYSWTLLGSPAPQP